MTSPYSTIAVKYVGSSRAVAALDELRTLRAAGRASLREAAIVTRSTGGEMNCESLQPVALQQRMLRSAAAGFMLGLSMRRRLRWTLLGAVLGAVGGWIAAQMERERLFALLPYVEKNESVLYLQVEEADWPDFQAAMQPHIQRGLPVVQDIAAAHAPLREMLPHEEQQRPRRQHVPEPSTTGSRAARGPQPADTRPPSQQAAEDDLTALRGIGPVLSERLRQHGVHTFAQLAAMHVEEVAAAAGISAARVSSDDWIGQAKQRAALS